MFSEMSSFSFQRLKRDVVAIEGRSLQQVVADWAAIEARMNPWLSAHATSEAKLDLFRTGADIYKHNASRTFNVPVDAIDKEQRQIGKTQELACGYGGGVSAFASMGRIYGVNLPEADSRRMVDA